MGRTINQNVVVILIYLGLLSPFLVETINGSPITTSFLKPRTERARQDVTRGIFLKQLENPSEVFTVLMIIGGDIVQKAVAQMTCEEPRSFTFVAFSFGWVSYAFNALLSAFGEGRLMPDPDCPAVVITIKSRMSKVNASWMIGRLIRDLEREVERTLEEDLETESKTGRTWIGIAQEFLYKVAARGEVRHRPLVLSVYEGVQDEPAKDWIWKLYFPVTIVQMVVASIPIYSHKDRRNWSILLITIIGTLLAISTGSLKEWQDEKFGRDGKSHVRTKIPDFILTRGNGHGHAFLIKGSRLNLEHLAGSRHKAGLGTRVLSVGFAILWVMFLIVAGGLEEDTWYLFGVGALGMIQNIAVAGWQRCPASHGIPLARTRMLGSTGPKVREVLLELEKDTRFAGLAARPEYFPDYTLTPKERRLWKEFEDRWDLYQEENDMERALERVVPLGY